MNEIAKRLVDGINNLYNVAPGESINPAEMSRYLVHARNTISSLVHAKEQLEQEVAKLTRIRALVDAGWNVRVQFTTDGDYYYISKSVLPISQTWYAEAEGSDLDKVEASAREKLADLEIRAKEWNAAYGATYPEDDP